MVIRSSSKTRSRSPANTSRTVTSSPSSYKNEVPLQQIQFVMIQQQEPPSPSKFFRLVFLRIFFVVVTLSLLAYITSTQSENASQETPLVNIEEESSSDRSSNTTGNAVHRKEFLDLEQKLKEKISSLEHIAQRLAILEESQSSIIDSAQTITKDRLSKHDTLISNLEQTNLQLSQKFSNLESSIKTWGRDLESKLTEDLGSKLVSDLALKQASDLESKLVNDLESKLSKILESKLYANLESKLSKILESKSYADLDSKLSKIIESKLYADLESKLSKSLNSKLENDLESKLKMMASESKLEITLESKLEMCSSDMEVI